MTDPSTPDRDEASGDRDSGREDSSLERYFRPVVEDSALRPVVISVVIGLSTMIGWGLLLAVRNRRPAAILAIVLLALLSTEWIVRARRSNGRLGAAGWSVIVLWGASAIFALGGHFTGYL